MHNNISFNNITNQKSYFFAHARFKRNEVHAKGSKTDTERENELSINIHVCVFG